MSSFPMQTWVAAAVRQVIGWVRSAPVDVQWQRHDPGGLGHGRRHYVGSLAARPHVDRSLADIEHGRPRRYLRGKWGCCVVRCEQGCVPGCIGRCGPAACVCRGGRCGQGRASDEGGCRAAILDGADGHIGSVREPRQRFAPAAVAEGAALTAEHDPQPCHPERPPLRVPSPATCGSRCGCRCVSADRGGTLRRTVNTGQARKET